MDRPEIAVLVSSFERPKHLLRSLASIAAQEGVSGRFEVVVTDDGSADETQHLVEAFARNASFRVAFTTHAHHGFQLARCRNEGVAASRAPYLLFVDGDCVLPPDHLRRHLEFRRPGRVVCGDCFRLDEATSARVTESTIRTGEYLRWIPRAERRRMISKAWHAVLYERLHIPMRPRLTGNNVAIWRSDFEGVNGFDEHFVGWGLEDNDFQRRLERIGVRARSILRQTVACHLWHPPAPSFSRNNLETGNLRYFHRPGVLTRCLDGLTKRDVGELNLRFSGELLPDERCEVEIAFCPGTPRFSNQSECKVLVVRSGHTPSRSQTRSADYVLHTDGDPNLADILPFAEENARPKLAVMRAGVENNNSEQADDIGRTILTFESAEPSKSNRRLQSKGRAA